MVVVLTFSSIYNGLTTGITTRMEEEDFLTTKAREALLDNTTRSYIAILPMNSITSDNNNGTLTKTSVPSLPSSSKQQLPKIFGIGLKKTGTSTLDAMFRKIASIIVRSNLTTASKHSLVAGQHGRRRNRDLTRTMSDKHMYFQDDPWFLSSVYKEMSKRHPTSKFILTGRDSTRWYKSVYRWVYCPTKANLRQQLFGTKKLEWYRQLFNATTTSQKDMILAYDNHRQEVYEYFQSHNQSYRLLEIDFTSSGGNSNSIGNNNEIWRKICQFVELPMNKCPMNEPIPHTNPTPKECYNITVA